MSAPATPQSPSLTLEQALQQATTHHRAGQLQDAERLYRLILQTQPTHSDANHNLGVLAVQVKQPAASLPYFQAAMASNPNQGQYWVSYIDALIQDGQNELARQVLAQGMQRGLQGDVLDALTHRLAIAQPVREPVDLQSQPAEQGSLPVVSLASEEPSKEPGKKAPKSRPSKPAKPARQASPSAQEMNRLGTLYQCGHYVEMEALAQSITLRFPAHGVGWKALGTALLQQRHTHAVAPLQKAAALLPADAEVHITLGSALNEQGRPVEAEASYRRALALQPRHASAHGNLGNALYQQQRLNEAEASYRRALELKPDYAEAHTNLGNILKERGRLAESEASHRRALALRPDAAAIHTNLGNTLHDQGRLAEAEACHRTALELQPDCAEIHSNLGNALVYRGISDQAIAAYHKALLLDPGNIGLDAAVWLAVLYYLEGDFEQSQAMLRAAQPVMATPDRKHQVPRSYWAYLAKLLGWHQQCNPKKSSSPPAGILHVIGESHALSAHGIVICYREREMQCAAQWIAGCKQWHLANDAPNKFKAKFETLMQKLPPQSTILLTIGEIDCRPDEGVLSAWKKSGYTALDAVIDATVDGYVRYVGRIGKQYGHQMIVGGVPATHIALDGLTVAAAAQFVGLIRTFNAVLRARVREVGMDFLDVYALTDRGDGIADGQSHIDDRHLLPSAMAEAFERYCLRS